MFGNRLEKTLVPGEEGRMKLSEMFHLYVRDFDPTVIE
jgi:hypothetical protein